MAEKVLHTGSCHCGAVKYEVMAPDTVNVSDCNCSICTKKQNHHFMVPATEFKLLSGHDNLTTYTFGTHKAKHIFCQTCGVQSFYFPRSHPDCVAIMPHCIDSNTMKKMQFEKFDGQNWEKSQEEREKAKRQKLDE